MKYLLWSLVTLVVIAGLITVIGYLLPAAHTASRDALIAAPAPDVFATISDVVRYPDWWSDISRVEMLTADGGRVRFREHMSSGPVVMEVEQATTPSRFVTRIADPDQPFGGTWTFELVPAGSGTRVTITERGEVYNPIFRFMSRFIFGYTGTMESCLAALTRKFHKP
jgi:uncharacterized protein YndB with AHSA1/START domain